MKDWGTGPKGRIIVETALQQPIPRAFGTNELFVTFRSTMKRPFGPPRARRGLARGPRTAALNRSKKLVDWTFGVTGAKGRIIVETAPEQLIPRAFGTNELFVTFRSTMRRPFGPDTPDQRLPIQGFLDCFG